MLKKTYSIMTEGDDSQNPSTSNNLSMPFINNMLSKFTKVNQNFNNKNKNESIIKELSQDLREREDLMNLFENVSKELILMGFSPNIVLHSFLAFKYQTVEEGI